LSNSFYRGADCCIIVFDITNRESYEGIEQWKNNFIESIVHYENLDHSQIEIPILLVGNKLDLGGQNKREVEAREVRADWVDSGEAIEYIETSALNLTKVERLFTSIAEQANDFQLQMQEQRETINELGDQYNCI
jgi:GTPase SAR1 family protein